MQYPLRQRALLQHPASRQQRELRGVITRRLIPMPDPLTNANPTCQCHNPELNLRVLQKRRGRRIRTMRTARRGSSRQGKCSLLIDIRHAGRLDVPICLVILYNAQRVDPEIRNTESQRQTYRVLECRRDGAPEDSFFAGFEANFCG